MEEEEVVENERPTNVTQLMEHSVDSESPYHLLGLMALRGVIWNLDINIYLLDNLKYQVRGLVNSHKKKLEYIIKYNSFFVETIFAVSRRLLPRTGEMCQ